MFSPMVARPNLRQNESGQATIEAVLLGLISFLLVMGLVYQFHAGFRDYVDNYFGNYLVCLLETGELPSLGGQGGGVCSEALASFELGEEGPGMQRSSGNSGSDGSPSEDSPTRSAEGHGSAGGAGNISYVNTRSGRGSSSSAGEEGAPAGTDQKESSSNGSAGDAGAPGTAGYQIVEVRESSGSSVDTITVKRVTPGTEASVQAAGSGTKTLIAKENENALAATKLTFNPDSLKRTPDSEEAGMDWNFSDYLRYLIILAIIIAIIVIVGGQALQISKSRDL